MNLTFELAGEPIQAAITDLVIAGWTGRDSAAVEHHIAELQALGVQRPRQVPMFYRLAPSLLTTEPSIDAVGEDSSGEVEFVLLSLEQGLFVGVGSDHTDRKLEAYGVTVSKQVCPKPIGRALWKFSDVRDHWEQLTLRSHVTRGGTRQLYQEGSVAQLRHPSELIELFGGGARELARGAVMFCGTLPVIGPIAGGERLELELWDPVLGRSLRRAYSVRQLPIVD